MDAKVRREGRERRLSDSGKILAVTMASPEAGVPAGRMPHRENAGSTAALVTLDKFYLVQLCIFWLDSCARMDIRFFFPTKSVTRTSHEYFNIIRGPSRLSIFARYINPVMINSALIRSCKQRK